MLGKLRCVILAGAFAALMLPPSSASALDKVRLGKAVPNSFAFGATEVGMEAKIFENEGIEIEVTSFRGDAQLQQALAADMEVGPAPGPGAGFRPGATAIGVAAMYGRRRTCAGAANGHAGQGAGRPQGKRIGVTTMARSRTAGASSAQQGWSSDGIRFWRWVCGPPGRDQRGEQTAWDRVRDRLRAEAARLNSPCWRHRQGFLPVIFKTDDPIDKRRPAAVSVIQTVAFMRANGFRRPPRRRPSRKTIAPDLRRESAALDGA